MNVLLDNWHDLVPRPWGNVALAFMAVLCGWIVGAERQKKEKPAGLRTVIMVTLGSAVFTLVSLAIAGSRGDPGRVAAQIVTGIGFLGAGAILHGPLLGVTGMTTAATVWMMAAVGMVVGVGHAGAGLGLSGLVFAVLRLISVWEDRALKLCPLTCVVILFEPAGGKTEVRIEETLVELHIPYRPEDFSSTADGLRQLRLSCCRADRHHREFLLMLAGLPEVKEIRHDNPAT